MQTPGVCLESRRAPAHDQAVSSSTRPFSIAWVVVSMMVFVGVELMVSMLVGRALLKHALSVPLSFTIQALLHVSSYLIGGFLIGLVSPKRRIVEPAAGAFLSVALMFALTTFMPSVFFRWDGSKVLIAGTLALVFALVGARAGEKLTGNL